MHNIRYRTRLRFRRTVQHSQEFETLGATLCSEFFGRTQREPEHDTSLSGVRIARRVGTVTGSTDAVADADAHAEPTTADASSRESTLYAAHVILVLRLT